MASITRDVIMTFRGQNYLSSAIRRVGRDVGGLSRIRSLQVAQTQNAVNLRRLATQKAILAQEQYSIQNGARNLTMQMRRAGLTDKEMAANRTLHGLETRRLGVFEMMKKNQVEISTIQAVAQRRFGQGVSALKLEVPKGVSAEEQRAIEEAHLAAQAGAAKRVPALKDLPARLAKRTPKELSALYSGAITQTVRLQRTQDNINQGAEIYTNRIKNQSLASQKFAEQTRNEAIQLRLKGEQIETINLAEIKQIELQKQLMMQQEALPTEKWIQYSQAIEHTGRVMQMFGVIGTAVFAFLAKSAAEFQSQAALAATQARPPNAGDAATARIQLQVTQQTFKLMEQFPAQASEQLDAFYQIFSGTNIQNVKVAAADLKVFNEMAVAGGTDLKSMTEAGITLLNTFPTEFKSMRAAAEEFFRVVRYGRITADQLANSLGYITPVARLVGLSFADVGENLAFLTRQTGGKMVRMDAQGLGRLIQLLARTDVASGLASKGIEVFSRTTGRMRNPIQIVMDIAKHMKLTRQEAVNFFKTISAAGSGGAGTTGTIQAIRTFGQLYESYLRARNEQKNIRNDNNEFEKSYQRMSKSADVAFHVFISRLRVVGLILGSSVIPVFVALSKPVSIVVNWFLRLSQHSQRVIGLILGIGAVVTLLAGTFLMFVGTISSMLGRLRLFIGYMKEGQGLFGKFGYSALTASEQLGITNAAIMGTNEQLVIMKQLIMDIATGAPIGPVLSTGLATPGGVILPPGVQRNAERAAKIQEERRLQTATDEERLTPKGRRSFFASRRGEVPPGERGSINVGAAAMMGMIALPLATQVPMLNTVIKKLGGIKTLMVTIGILWAGIWIRGQMRDPSSIVSKIIGSLSTLISKMASTVAAWVAGQTAMQASAVETATVVDSASASMVASEAAATLGISLIVAGLAYAAAYAITHWQKVRHWFGTFWGWMKKNGVALWSGMVQDMKLVGKAIFDFIVAPFRLVIDALSHLPGFLGGHKFQAAKEVLDAVDKKLTPDFTAPGRAKAREAAAQARAAAASRAAAEASAQADKHQKQVDHIHKQIEQKAFQHRVRMQTTRMRDDPGIMNEIRSLQTLRQRAIATTDLNRRNALAKKYVDQLAQAEQGLSKAQRTAFNILLSQGVPAQTQSNRSVQEWIRTILAAKRAMEKHPYDIGAATKFEKLQTQLNAQFKNQPELLSAINDVLGQYNSNLSKTATTGKDAAVTLDQVQSGVESMYQSILQMNQANMGQLFQGPWLTSPFMQAAQQFGFKPQPRDYMKDARAQLGQFRSFNRLLNNLRRRGAPEAMIQQLQQMGPQAIDAIRGIAHMSQPELRKYFGVFHRQQQAIHRQTMRDLNHQLRDYLKYGRKVGLAMAAGVRQESPAITKAIDRAIRKAFGHIPTGTGGPGGGNQRGGDRHNHTHHHHHDHVHIHGDGQSAETKARHARFRARQRHNHPSMSPGRN